jgi:hypothetical protein
VDLFQSVPFLHARRSSREIPCRPLYRKRESQFLGEYAIPSLIANLGAVRVAIHLVGPTEIQCFLCCRVGLLSQCRVRPNLSARNPRRLPTRRFSTQQHFSMARFTESRGKLLWSTRSDDPSLRSCSSKARCRFGTAARFFRRVVSNLFPTPREEVEAAGVALVSVVFLAEAVVGGFPQSPDRPDRASCRAVRVSLLDMWRRATWFAFLMRESRRQR